MPILDNYFSYEYERTNYIERASLLQRDPWGDMSSWVRDDPKSCLKNKKIIICGSHHLLEILSSQQQLAGQIIGIVDDFLKKREDQCLGIPVLSTDEWINLARKDRSIVSFVYCMSRNAHNHFMKCIIQYQLRYLSFLDAFRIIANEEFKFSTCLFGLHYFHHAIFHAEEHMRCAEQFEDDFSRFTFFNMLNFRLDGNPNRFDRCLVTNGSYRAFHNNYAYNGSFFEFTSDEVVVEAGAFDGDSLEVFLRMVKGEFKKIYCFEPNPKIAQKFRERLSYLQKIYGFEIGNKINFREEGLWNKKNILEFNSNLFAPWNDKISTEYMTVPQGGHIIDGGIMQNFYKNEKENAVDTIYRIFTVALDDVIDQPVTFIRLEVEGSELKALEGACNIIERDRPCMSVAAYHKPEDFLTIPELVKNIGKQYKVSMRHHGFENPQSTLYYFY